MRNKFSRLLLLPVLAIATLVGSTLAPTSAIASGYNWGWFYYSEVTQGETVAMMVIDGDKCPNIGFQDLAVDITDSNTDVHHIHLQQTKNNMGDFNALYLNIPITVSPGIASVVLTCSLGSNITRTFEPVALNVHSPSSSIQFDRTPNIWGEVRISSNELCQSSGMAVGVEVNSVATYWNGYSYQYVATRHSNEGIAYPDSSTGYWSLTLSLTPFVPGQPGYNEYIEGQVYSIRVFCMSQPSFEVVESPPRAIVYHCW